MFVLKSLCHVCPLQAETSLTENITNQDSYFRAVTFQPLKAEGGDDETQYDDSNDSYTTYSYEYESSEDYSDPKKDTNSDKKLFRSSKIKLGKGSYKAKNSDKKLFSSSKIVIGKGSGGKGRKNNDMMEEELLLETLKEGAPSKYNQEDYKLGHQEDDLKTRKGEKKDEFDGSIERSKEEKGKGGSDESRPSWGLNAFEQPEDLSSHDYEDTRSSFITFPIAFLCHGY